VNDDVEKLSDLSLELVLFGAHWEKHEA
jgi:hypothetical protein